MAEKAGRSGGPRRSIGARRNPETEAAVLDAAAELFLAGGPKALSMEAVARKARAGKATLYRWWPGRGALILAVYERMKGETDYADTGSLRQDLTAFLDYLMGHWRRPVGQLFRLIIAEAQSDPDMAEALDRYRAERLAALTAVVARGAARGELVPGADAEAIAEAVIALGWLRLLTGRTEADCAALVNVVLDGWVIEGA